MTKVAKKRRISRRVKPTVWQALNQPVVEIHEDFAKNVFFAALVLIMIAWLLPYWAGVYSVSAASGCEVVAGASTEYTPHLSSPTSGEELKEGVVVGTVPTWYYVVTAIPGDVADAFAIAAADVLDISDQVSDTVEFYEPGVSAVWAAWTDLLMDPYSY